MSTFIFPTFAEAPFLWILLALIVPVTVTAFYYKPLYHALLFHPYEVFRGKRLHTLFTSVLVHRGWWHLFWNIALVFGLGTDLMGVFNQEYAGVNPHILFMAFVMVTIGLPNLLIGLRKKNEIAYTAAGVSGLAFGLIGATGLYFPMEEMGKSALNPFTHAYQYWIGFLVVFALLSLRKNRTNSLLHLYAFLAGSLFSVILVPASLVEIGQDLCRISESLFNR